MAESKAGGHRRGSPEGRRLDAPLSLLRWFASPLAHVLDGSSHHQPVVRDAAQLLGLLVQLPPQPLPKDKLGIQVSYVGPVISTAKGFCARHVGPVLARHLP